jgi:tetratricopeptide (TPR) repeat protein
VRVIARTSHRAAALALAMVLSSPAGLWAASRTSLVDKARQLIEEAEFDQAIRVINDALVQPDNSDAMLVSLYELQGTAYLYLGQADKARSAFEKLLQAAPDHQLPKGTSSKISKLFEKVREDQKANKVRPVKLSHEKITAARAGERLDVMAQITDLPGNAKARLYYRRAGTEAYSSTTFSAEGGGSFVAHVPAFELPTESGEYALEYFVEIADSGGRRLAGVGDSLGPIVAHVTRSSAERGPEPVAPAVTSESWYQKWWVWTIVGVVAAGAVGAAVAVPLLQDKRATLPVAIKVQQ